MTIARQQEKQGNDRRSILHVHTFPCPIKLALLTGFVEKVDVQNLLSRGEQSTANTINVRTRKLLKLLSHN